MGLRITSLRPLRSSLFTNAAYLWLGEIVFAGLGFAFWNVVTRLYSPDTVGLAGAAVTSIMLLSTVASLGLGFAIVRFSPQSDDGGRLLLGRSLVAVVSASALAGIFFLASLPLWSQELTDLLWQTPGHIVGYLLFVALLGVLQLLTFVFVAYRRGDFVLIQRILVGALRIPLVILLAGLGSAIVIVAVHSLAVLGGLILIIVVLLPRCTGRPGLPLSLEVWKLAPVAGFALSNLASQVLRALSWLVLPLIVIALVEAEEAGFFYIGWAVAGIGLSIAQQLSLSLFAEGSHDVRGFGTQARGALLMAVVLGGIFAVGTFFLGDLVLGLFGSEYAERSSTVLKLLAAATPLAAVTNIYLGTERVRGRMVPLVAVSTVVAVVMLAVTVVLVPLFGLAGVGYGVLAGNGSGALVSLVLLYQMLGRGPGLVTPTEGASPEVYPL